MNLVSLETIKQRKDLSEGEEREAREVILRIEKMLANNPAFSGGYERPDTRHRIYCSIPCWFRNFVGTDELVIHCSVPEGKNILDKVRGCPIYQNQGVENNG